MFTSVSIFARVFASSDDSSKFPWLSVYVVLFKSVYCDDFQVHVVKYFPKSPWRFTQFICRSLG